MKRLAGKAKELTQTGQLFLGYVVLSVKFSNSKGLECSRKQQSV